MFECSRNNWCWTEIKSDYIRLYVWKQTVKSHLNVHIVSVPILCIFEYLCVRSFYRCVCVCVLVGCLFVSYFFSFAKAFYPFVRTWSERERELICVHFYHWEISKRPFQVVVVQSSSTKKKTHFLLLISTWMGIDGTSISIIKIVTIKWLWLKHNQN